MGQFIINEPFSMEFPNHPIGATFFEPSIYHRFLIPSRKALRKALMDLIAMEAMAP